MMNARSKSRRGTLLAALVIGGLTSGLLAACSAEEEDQTAAITTPEGEIELLPFDGELAAEVPDSYRDRTLIFGVSETAPYTMIGSDGAVTGLVPDLVAQFESILGIDVEFEVTKFDAVIPGLESGRIDLSGPAGDFVERQERVDFADFAQSNVTVLLAIGGDFQPESRLDLCGAVIGIEKGAATQNVTDAVDVLCADAGKPLTDVKTFPDTAAGVLALQSGRIDGYLAPTSSNSVVAEQSPDTFEVIKIDDMVDLPSGMATYGLQGAKGAGIAEALVSALRRLDSEGVYTALFKKWGIPLSAIESERIVLNGSSQQQAG